MPKPTDEDLGITRGKPPKPSTLDAPPGGPPPPPPPPPPPAPPDFDPDNGPQ